jgi:predicted phosphodiesterase
MKRFWLILNIILLVGVAVLCAVRWKAWFSNPPEPQWQGDTISIQFSTFGLDSLPHFGYNGIYWENCDEMDTFQILVLGDVHNSITHEQWNAIAKRHPHIDCFAQIGDFVERGYFYYNQMLYREIKGTPFEQMPLINVPGNHEYLKGIKRTLPDYWLQTFKHPENGPQEFLGTTYYVDFEELRVIAINTNGLQRLKDYTRVNAWLKKTISEAEDRFVVVLMHHPVYSCAAGRQNYRIAATFIRPLKQADLVFAGHDHNYARRMPFVCTNAATKPHQFKPNAKNECSGDGLRAYEILSLYGDTLRMQTRVLETGELFDEVLIVKHDNEREIIEPLK